VVHELDELDPALDPDPQPSPDDLTMAPALRRPVRRDGMALGFGIAFIVFGIVGLLRAAGAPVPSTWLYPIILIGLGVAGLMSSLSRGWR
jgi:hypothetical protein